MSYDPENNLYDFVEMVLGRNRRAIAEKRAEMDSLADLECKSVPAPETPKAPWGTVRVDKAELKKRFGSTKKEKNMCYDCGCETNTILSAPKSDTQTAREYLMCQLSEIAYEKYDELRKTFGLQDDAQPKNVKEMIERIIEGKYVLPEKYAEKNWYSASDYIRWRDPSVKEDQEGLDKALQTRDKEQRKTANVIAVSDPKEGLAALEAFESNTFH